MIQIYKPKYDFLIWCFCDLGNIFNILNKQQNDMKIHFIDSYGWPLSDDSILRGSDNGGMLAFRVLSHKRKNIICHICYIN